jgi:DNA (cytosine-5)-methyltransferase 1
VSTQTKLISFFSGAGFLDLGFESEGFEVIYANESHVPFLSAYKHSRHQLGIEPPQYGYCDQSITDLLTDSKLNANLGDIVSRTRTHPALVGFIGGPPCPDFSIGGKNRGRHGERGKLSETYVNLICQQKPDFFLFENVKGLWQTKIHRSFYDYLKNTLMRAGYVLTDRLINSIEYGAPQDRERIILLGFRDQSPTAVTRFPWLQFADYPSDSAFNFAWPTTSPFSENTDLSPPESVPLELTVQYWFQRNDVLNHPNAKHCFTPRAGLARFQTVPEGDDSRKSFKRLHRWRYSPTAAYGNNEVHLHPYAPRRISVAEALSIQSLPREFELPPNMTLSNMFKTVGNGVPYLAAKMIARSVKTFLEKPHELNRFKPSSRNRTAAA